MTLTLGPGFDVPEDIATESVGLLGQRGSGKSNGLVVIAEELHAAGIPWAAIDPKGDWFGVRSSPDGTGLDGDPPFVHCHRHETARLVRAVEGELKLMDSPLDPIADVPVRRVVSMEYAELASTQRGEVVGRVPAESLLPFVHQRYDDLSVLGAKS